MTDEYDFHIERFGREDNAPVLLLHGFMGSSADWTSLAQPLSDQYPLRCVAPDLPGHGKTRAHGGAETYGIERTAEGVVALLDSMGIKGCHLIGYSMGGRLGLFLALRYPERFMKVVLESASPGLRTATEREERRRRDEALAERLESDSYEHFLDFWYEQPLFRSLRSTPGFGAVRRHRLETANPSGYALSLRMMGTGAQPSLWDDLRQIQVPVLLITGRLDTKFHAIAENVAGRLPQARWESVDGAGHAVHEERPTEFVNLVGSFLASEHENT